MIGDRRTAALVAADGTIDWLCLPDFDGKPLFGALLDANLGGYWKLGPETARLGIQQYREHTSTMETQWHTDDGTLCLADTMIWPQTDRPSQHKDMRIVVRRLTCKRGGFRCGARIRLPQDDAPKNDSNQSQRYESFGRVRLQWWCSRPIDAFNRGARFELREGEELISVLAAGPHAIDFDDDFPNRGCNETDEYWRSRLAWLHRQGSNDEQFIRAAMLVRLLTYSPTGALVAAPTSSLPERIGGDWNADYRLCWLRDTSLSLSLIAQLGDLGEARQYLRWLCSLESASEMPLQVLYGIHGETTAPQRRSQSLSGYRGSTPVRFGNHAFKQLQLDAFGYFAICLHDYLNCGGSWQADFWKLAEDVADFVSANWQRESNGIWELPQKKHFVSGRVMSWAALDRIIQVGDKIGKTQKRNRWQQTRDEIHREVMERGWSERMQAFKQHYDGDILDAAVLLIPIVDFLPANHPRVVSTIEQVAKRLSINGFLYRFDPEEMTPESFQNNRTPMGQFEGAFVPCTFWLATALAKLGRIDEAQSIVSAVEKVAGSTGLLAEGLDPRDGTFLGNFPLLFSHAEHIRALCEIETARARQARGG